MYLWMLFIATKHLNGYNLYDLCHTGKGKYAIVSRQPAFWNLMGVFCIYAAGIVMFRHWNILQSCKAICVTQLCTVADFCCLQNEWLSELYPIIPLSSHRMSGLVYNAYCIVILPYPVHQYLLSNEEASILYTFLHFFMGLQYSVIFFRYIKLGYW